MGLSNLKISKNKKGFSLVEALISMGILTFVIVSLLSAFSYQQFFTKNTTSKNIAISFAEAKLEELLKFSGSDLSLMPSQTIIDYVVRQGNKFTVYTIDPDRIDQYRRTANIASSLNLVTVSVTVEYGKKGSKYPFNVVLSTKRW